MDDLRGHDLPKLMVLDLLLAIVGGKAALVLHLLDKILAG